MQRLQTALVLKVHTGVLAWPSLGVLDFKQDVLLNVQALTRYLAPMFAVCVGWL